MNPRIYLVGKGEKGIIAHLVVLVPKVETGQPGSRTRFGESSRREVPRDISERGFGTYLRVWN